ncbi:MAG: radical SAM protein, partial [Prolixibacteraceae bacterium]|nr:radical SAM protein [Prolixibacteraceae bacterium]
MKPEKTLLLISGNRFANPYPVYPIAISYLESYLSQNLPEFRIITFDCNLDSISALHGVISENNPAYVGLSLRNIDGANSLGNDDFISGYREIAAIVRAATLTPLILGGAGFSIFPNELMHLLQADYGIVGEGEESLRQLITALENETPTAGIEGLITRNGQAEPHRNYLKTLNVRFDERFVDFYWKQSGMINIQTKRGCPLNCIYCSYPHIDGRKVRTLDPRLIVENITQLNKDKGINYFFFTDSVFNIDDDFNAQLAHEIIKSNVRISWGAYFSPKNIGDEQIALYRKSGLTHIEFGTESFSDTTLDSYAKGFTMHDVFNASSICLKNNVYYAHFLILGGY